MAVRQSARAGTAAARSIKSATPLWCAAAPNAQVHAISSLVTVSTSSSSNTKGAWQQLLSAASNTADTGLLLLMNPLTIFTGDNACLIDIGTGTSGSESVLISNIASAGQQANASCQVLPIPIFIPSGTRIAYRAQVAASGAQTVYMLVALAKTSGMHLLPRSVDSLGVTASTSHATALTGTANVTYTPIVSSTPQPYQSLVLNISSASKTGINANFRATLAVGPSGGEVDLCTVDARQETNGNLNWSNTYMTFLGLPGGGYIPAGSRISVKHNIAANPGYLEASVIGVPYG